MTWNCSKLLKQQHIATTRQRTWFFTIPIKYDYFCCSCGVFSHFCIGLIQYKLIWLVVSTPLKNITVVRWDYYSQCMEKKKCSKPPTSRPFSNVTWSGRHQRCSSGFYHWCRSHGTYWRKTLAISRISHPWNKTQKEIYKRNQPVQGPWYLDDHFNIGYIWISSAKGPVIVDSVLHMN